MATNSYLQSVDNRIPDFLLNPQYRIARHLLLQLFVLLITLNVFWDVPDHFIFTYTRFYSWFIYYLVFNGVIYFNRYVLAPRFLLENKRGRYVLSVFGVTVVAVLIIGILQGLQTDTTEYPAPQSISGILLAVTSSIISVGFVVAGVSSFLIFGHWLLSNKRIEELEAATLQTELKFLKNQINPHFLFNMLNNANYLIMDNRNEAAEVLLKLEDLLRYQINDTSKEKVSLTADIRFLNDFLNLEKLRRDDFDYAITKEGDIEEIDLPPFLFIPFVENAVKHSQDGDMASFIHISFRVYNKKLEFLCENSKPAETGTDKNRPGGIGLKNIQRRLDMLFPGRYKLDIRDEDVKYIVKLNIVL